MFFCHIKPCWYHYLFVYLRHKLVNLRYMDRLLEVCDEMASSDEFITFKDIFENCFNITNIKLKGKEYNKLRQRLNRDNNKYDFIEYKQEGDLGGGFRYKKGFEFFYKRKEERNAFKKLTGNEKKLYKTGGLQMLFDEYSSSDHYVEFEWISDFTNLSLVKKIVNYIKEERVISFWYHKGYCEIIEVTIHPFLLKEYNSRWFLFGNVCQQDGTWITDNYSLDRILYGTIVNKDGKRKNYIIKSLPQIKYKCGPQNFNRDYFKDIVGVTRRANDSVEKIIIKTVDFKVHHLLCTKKIHPSQIEEKEFDDEKMEGEFSIEVIPNIELQTKLLSFGPGLYVVGEGIFQQKIRDAVFKMAELYAKSK